MYFEIINSIGTIGAGEDVAQECVNRGFTNEEIAFFPISNGTEDLETGVPLFDTIVFINATQEEIMQEIERFINE